MAAERRGSPEDSYMVRGTEVMVLTNGPGFWVRRGIYLLYILFLVIVCASILISYNDTIEVNGEIKSDPFINIGCYAEVKMLSQDSGKIETGQKAMVKPGNIQGWVGVVNDPLPDGSFLIRIMIPQSANTPCIPGTKIQAEITIEQRLLIEKLWN